MGLFVAVLAFLVSLPIGLCEQENSASLPFMHRAVLNAHDVTKPFAQNFYTILNAICPISVYCEETANAVTYKYEVRNETTEMTDVSNSSSIQNLITDSLAFLRNKSPSLKGCCTRCSCESDCLEKDNCCPLRNVTLLTDDVIAEPKVKQECVAASLHMYLPGSGLSKAASMGLGYYMVTDCFIQNANQTAVSKCRYPNATYPVEITPVYSFETDRHYKNRFCAECNNVFSFDSWKLVLIFSPTITLTGKTQIPTSAEELYRSARFSKMVTIIYEPPILLRNRLSTYKCLIFKQGEQQFGANDCKNFSEFTEAENSFLKDACAFREIRFETLLNTMKNVFCFLCTNIHATFDGDSGSSCESGSKISTSAFSAILNLGQRDIFPSEQDDIDSTEDRCTCTEYFDRKKGICRQIMCPVGEQFVSCHCKPFLTRIVGLPITVYLDITPVERSQAEQLANQVKKGGKRKANYVIAKVVQSLNATWGPLQSDGRILVRVTTVSDNNFVKFYNLIVIIKEDVTDSRLMMKQMFNDLRRGLTTRIFNIPVMISLGRIRILQNEDLTNTSLFDDVHDSDIEHELIVSGTVSQYMLARFAQPLSKTVFCKRVKLDEDERERLWNSTWSGISPTYLEYVYREKDNTICLEEFESIFIKSESACPCGVRVFIYVSVLVVYL